MTDLSKYNLLSNIISLINSEEYESSINNISISLKIPIPYIRHTIVALLNNSIFQSCLITSNDSENDNESTFMDLFIDDSNNAIQELIAGKYDDTIWNLELSLLDHYEYDLLPLTHLEYSSLEAMGETALSLKRYEIFEKKDTINPISSAINGIRNIFQQAILCKDSVSFTYLQPDKEKQLTPVKVTCFPQEIITNVSDNWLYVRSTELATYRLDRVSHIKRLYDSKSFPGYTTFPNQKYVWGASSYFNDEPVHVKLRIAPDTRNNIPKIKRDITPRKDTCKFYQSGNYYYYEDDIIGLGDFRRWIRGYGSSIVVIEPQSLRDSIISRAQENIDLYARSQNWGDL